MITGVEEFTCRLYGFGPRVKHVDEASEIKVNKMCGSSLELRPGLSIDLSTFPPCKRVLFQHTKRVNFQTCIWKRAHENNPEIPSPLVTVRSYVTAFLAGYSVGGPPLGGTGAASPGRS